MTRSDYIDILADELMAEPEWLTGNALLVDDLGMQSIDVVALIERLEDSHGVSIPRLDMGDVDTVDELWHALLHATGRQIAA